MCGRLEPRCGKVGVCIRKQPMVGGSGKENIYKCGLLSRECQRQNEEKRVCTQEATQNGMLKLNKG